MWLAIVVHLKTPQERPAFSVDNYRIFTYDSCNRKMRLDLARFFAYNYCKSRYDSSKLIIYLLLGPRCSFTTNENWVLIVVNWHFLNDCAVMSEYKYRKSFNRSWKLEDASTHKSAKTDGGTGFVNRDQKALHPGVSGHARAHSFASWLLELNIINVKTAVYTHC